MNSTVRRLLAVGAITASLAIAGCSSALGGVTHASDDPTSTTVASAKVAETVADAVEERVGWRPEVDCGAEDFALHVGDSHTCTITDPDSGLQWETAVELTNIDGSRFKVRLDISRKALNGDQLWSDSMSVTGPDLGATATSILARDDDGEFVVTCDEDEYQVALGTQIMCTYTDESGDRPVQIEVTAVKGSQFRVMVTVQ